MIQGTLKLYSRAFKNITLSQHTDVAQLSSAEKDHEVRLKSAEKASKWTLSPEYFLLHFSFSGLVSLCTLTLLAYERYNVVCKARAGLKLTMRRSIIRLLFVWIFCLFWAVTPLLGWSSYGPEGVQTSCSLAWEERSWSNYSYLIFYTLICFIFPVAVIIYCYSKVLTSMNKVGT